MAGIAKSGDPCPQRHRAARYGALPYRTTRYKTVGVARAAGIAIYRRPLPTTTLHETAPNATGRNVTALEADHDSASVAASSGSSSSDASVFHSAISARPMPIVRPEAKPTLRLAFFERTSPDITSHIEQTRWGHVPNSRVRAWYKRPEMSRSRSLCWKSGGRYAPVPEVQGAALSDTAPIRDTPSKSSD